MIIRSKGAFILRIDAFGLNLGRLTHDQHARSTEVRIERYECKQDEEYNSLYYRDGKWVEKELDQLVSVPDELLEYLEEENVFRATNSLNEFYIAQRSDLDKETISFLKSEDKWKYKLSYEYRIRARKRKKASYAKKQIIDLTNDNEEDIQEVEEMNDTENNQHDQQVVITVDDKSVCSHGHVSLEQGSFIVMKNKHDGIHFAKVITYVLHLLTKLRSSS
jgi:hypothetical protein